MVYIADNPPSTQGETMSVTVTPLPDSGDPERQWFRLDGRDNGTGVEFDNDEFAINENGNILNGDGCPLVESDWETVAVRNSLPAQ